MDRPGHPGGIPGGAGVTEPDLLHRTVYKIHSWLGLALAPVLFVICLSGTIAVFGHEIDWVASDAWRVEIRDGPYDWQAILEGAQAAHPYKRIDFILAPRHPGFAAQVLATPVGGEYVNVLVDPYSGEVRATTSYWNAWRFLRSFHRRLMVPNPAGILIVTGLGLFLMVSLITGILAYRKWWRIGLRVRWRQRLRGVLGDLHRSIGLACFVVALPIALSGAWYLVELVHPPAGPAAASVDLAEVPDRAEVDLGAMTATARGHFDRFEVGRVGLRARDEPLWIGGQTSTWFLRDEANVVAFDPLTGAATGVQRAGDLGTYQLLAHIANPLHFGTWGGLATQFVWFVAGLGLSASILVGTGIWFLRSTRRARPAERGHAAALAAGTVIAIGLIVCAIHFGSAEYRFWSQQHTAAPVTLWKGQLQSHDARLSAVDADADGAVEQLVLDHVRAEDPPPVEPLYIELGDRDLRVALEWTGLLRRVAPLPDGWDWKRLAGAGRIGIRGDAVTLTFGLPDAVTMAARATRPHPGFEPAPGYVWWVISAVAGAIIAALVAWSVALAAWARLPGR